MGGDGGIIVIYWVIVLVFFSGLMKNLETRESTLKTIELCTLK